MSANGYDPEAVRARYLVERDKRLVPGRADIRDLARDEHFARPGTSRLSRSARYLARTASGS